MKRIVSKRVARWLVAAALVARVPITSSTAEAATNATGAGEGERAKAAALAKKLQNPVASLISVPLQSNWDQEIGPADATRYTLNVQPVVPVTLTSEWNLITRTITPIIRLESPVSEGETESGLGDITQSFFLSPQKPVRGWIVGAGPVFRYPTASDEALGGEKLGVGPTAVLLKQAHGWTIGGLTNHLWSVAGDADRSDLNATFVQPFVSYTTKTYTTVSVNTEATYDWERSEWTLPLNLAVQQLLKVGGRPMALQVGGRRYAEAPDGGPEWGFRFNVTLLFPK